MSMKGNDWWIESIPSCNALVLNRGIRTIEWSYGRKAKYLKGKGLRIRNNTEKKKKKEITLSCRKEGTISWALKFRIEIYIYCTWNDIRQPHKYNIMN